jgi:DNA-binding transcriptional LysR family regulator
VQLRQLDLNLLKAFDALMDERNLTRAAERLAVTQPAVSATLNRLRDAIGDPLFVRAQRGVAPTARALALAVPIKRILADIEAALQPDVFDPATADFTVTISATDYALRAVVMPFVAALRPVSPRVRVAVVQAQAGELLGRMERGEVDLALITPEMAPPGQRAAPDAGRLLRAGPRHRLAAWRRLHGPDGHRVGPIGPTTAREGVSTEL